MFASISFLTPMTTITTVLVAVGLCVGFALLRWICGPPAAVARRWGLIGLRLLAVATLLMILLNPSQVSQSPGLIDRPDIFFLLDSSQSMAVGDGETRFDHSVRVMREAEAAVSETPHANVKLFRFGHRLTAVEGSQGGTSSSLAGDSPNRALNGEKPGSSARSFPANQAGKLNAAEVPPSKTKSKSKPLLPTDSDTQLLTALRQVSSRFGRRPPAGIVVFSDGRTHDESGAEEIASQFARLNVPVHVVPVGDTGKGGDVAIVACVSPPRARRFAEVEVQVFLRSYGYDGRRCEVSLSSPGTADGETDRILSPPVPVTLHDGFQSVGLSFRTESKSRKFVVSVSTMPDEVSTANNVFQSEVQIDRTKIRVLYVEGSSQPLQPLQRGTKYEVRGPYSDLQQALSEDEDIECVTLHSPNGRGRLVRVVDGASSTSVRGFPETVAELSAFDAMILSDVSADAFTEQQLGWIEKWVGQRGGGLLMVGGQRSFKAGRWDDTPIASMLPIEMDAESTDWIPGLQVGVTAERDAISHPVWTIVTDEQANREIVASFPSFFGANRWNGVKPNLTRVLAMSSLSVAESPEPVQTASVPKPASKKPSFFQNLQKNLTGRSPGVEKAEPKPISPEKPATVPTAPSSQPAIVVGQYGRGRTMAMAVPITSPWANDFLTKWGQGETRYYGKFWRNTVYWLTERSSIGRRRLVVTADKKFYRPGETISLSAAAFDEAANQTGSYKITSMIEPRSSLSDLESNYSPIRWPDGRPRESGESGPFIAWGEEFELPRSDAAEGKPAFALDLPVADGLSVGSASQSMRVELTAMEDFTQVDSTSLDIQILHDPFEQQNPFPNHDLLKAIAKNSQGQVITEPRQLTDILLNVSMSEGAPVITRTPLWSTWWLWTWLLGLLSLEWISRRLVGLA